MRRKSTAGMATGTDATVAAKSFLDNLQVQSLGQHDRKVIVFLSQVIVNGDIKFLKSSGYTYLSNALTSISNFLTLP